MQAIGLRASWPGWPGRISFLSVGFQRGKKRKLRKREKCRGLHRWIGAEWPRVLGSVSPRKKNTPISEDEERKYLR